MPPAGFDNNDIKPWRFRRRLSVISRPIIRLDESDDPSYLVAPALFRQSLLYNLTNAHEAKLSEKHFKSLEMRRWVGSQRNRLGHAFNLKVSQRLIELGWQAKPNKKLSEILNRKMPDIGDVDVLSWSSRSRRVFAIECKDLGFAKTHAEVGTYLKRFRGEVDDKGRPDELLRHLNRCKKLQEFADDLAKYVGATRSVEVIPLLVFSQPSPVIYRVPIGLTRDDIFTFDELHELVAREGA